MNKQSKSNQRYPLDSLGLFHRIEHDIQRVGLQRAMWNLLIRSGTTLKVHGLTPAVRNVLRKEPVLILANHPHTLDPWLLLASLPPRANAYIILTHILTGISQAFDRHVIPVYVQHDTKSTFRKLFLRALVHFPTYTPTEEHARNLSSIAAAAYRLSAGAAVLHFPTGRSSKATWYRGVGHLLHNLTGRRTVYVVYAQISGTSSFDVLRCLPHIGSILSPLTVWFSEPKSATTLRKNDPQTITSFLEADYLSWMSALKA